MTDTPLRAAWVLLLGLLGTLAAAPAPAQPLPPVRVIAEWEPALGTLIKYPFGIPQTLVVELARDDTVFVLVKTQQLADQCRDTLVSWGVDPDHVEFIICPVETIWPRDWGPHQIFDGNGQWGIIDPIFEGYPWVDVECGTAISSPGGHTGDDAVPGYVADYFDAPLFDFPAYLTGGNFLVDGHAAGFSTCTMVDENLQIWTEPQFLNLAAGYLGIANYHIVEATEDHGIQHIDCWFKPLDEETLLVKRPPTWHEEYERIERNVALLSAATTCYGRPYRIVRIDCPPYDGSKIAAYTNSLILNRRIFVPLFNIPGDAQAIQTFQDAMPGYEVVGFPWGSWYYYDALHCRTRAVFDRHMLRLTHRRMDAEVLPEPAYPLTAVIDDRSEAGLITDELRVYWRLAGDPLWSWLPLTPGGEPDTYGASLPGQAPGSTVEYYLAAADDSGRAETLPRTAPDGCYSFQVIDTGLKIEVPDPPVLVSPWTPAPFEVLLDEGDESLVPGTALLHCRLDGGAFWTAPLEALGGSTYRATLPRAMCDDLVEFYVSAEGSESGVKTSPPGAPAGVFAAEVGELAEVPLFSERFEGGLPAGWSTTGLWHVTTACQVDPPCDGSWWAYYGRDDSCDYDTGDAHAGTLTSPAIDLPDVPPGGSVTLTYCSSLETENEPGYDLASLYANGEAVDAPAESLAWQERQVDLTAHAGGPVVLDWSFDTVDDYYNDYHGWQVDALSVSATDLVCDFEFPCAPGDWTCDGVVDTADHARLVECLAGPDAAPEPGPPVTAEQCLAVFDFDADGDVDLADCQAFNLAL